MAQAQTGEVEQSATATGVDAGRWLAVVAVAVGTFAMVTVEQLPVGLLTSVSGALKVSAGTAGLMVTAPGLVAAATAPLLPVAIGRLDRRKVLIGLLTLMVSANLVSALAPNFGVLLASRLLVGASIGGFWALVSGLAVRMVPERYVPRATAITFGGATAANVLGVPAGTLIGGFTDWRTAFVALSGLGILVVAALAVLLPNLPATEPVRLRSLPQQFRVPAVRAGVFATFLLIGGHFTAFTFISPILQSLSGVKSGLIGPLLLGYGVAGIVGNFIAGTATGRNLRATVIGIAVMLTATLALFPLVGGTQITGVALLIVWGLAFGAVPVAVQTWIIKAAPEATEAASALNTSVFNLAIALGALFGGVVVNTVALKGVLWVGAALTVLTAAAIWPTRLDQRRGR